MRFHAAQIVLLAPFLFNHGTFSNLIFCFFIFMPLSALVGYLSNYSLGGLIQYWLCGPIMTDGARYQLVADSEGGDNQTKCIGITILSKYLCSFLGHAEFFQYFLLSSR